MNETQILILQSFFSPEEENRLRDALPGFSVRFCGPADWADALPEASFVIGNPPVSLLRSAKKLRLLQLISSGANQYAAPGALPEGAQLACATGSYGPGIAEYLLACTMSLFLRLPAYGANQRAHAWHDEGPVRAMKDASILVVGLGDIGGQYARRCHALGAHVTGVCRTKREAPPFVEELHTFDELDALLPRADAVALCVPETKQTIGLMDRRRLALMRPDSVLLNVGRGTAVVTADLVQALRNGTIGGAALDVTDPEPLPPDHPLWDEPRCILTPHISGGSHFIGTRERIFSICLENARRFAAGKAAVNLVDRTTGYRVSQP